MAEGLLDPLLPNILIQPEQESEVKVTESPSLTSLILCKTGTDEEDPEEQNNQGTKKDKRNKAAANLKDSSSRGAEQEK